MTQATNLEDERVEYEVTPNCHAHAMQHVAKPILEILNKYGQRNGNTFALYGGLYAMGCALAISGANLDPGVDLRRQLEPLLDGYQTMRETKTH